jgi:endonuclease YncB( thermonuclease family)
VQSEQAQILVILAVAVFLALRLLHLLWTRKNRGHAPTLHPFTGRVFVIDGDTVSVSGRRVRLFGMDAPELDQFGGLKAKGHLIRLAGGRTVRAEPRDIDCYGRTVARLWRGDVDLSAQMVLDGFAVATVRWHRDYEHHEHDARRNRRGLWAYGRIGDPAAHRRRTKAPGDVMGRDAPLASGNGRIVRASFRK